MEKIVIDTSVIVKWYIKEANTSKALTYLEKYKENKIDILLPSVAALELANALYFSAKLNNKILRKFLNNFYNLAFQIYPLNLDFILDAQVTMQGFDIAIYDSLFITLAKNENCKLITADKKHHKKEIYNKIVYLD